MRYLFASADDLRRARRSKAAFAALWLTLCLPLSATAGDGDVAGSWAVRLSVPVQWRANLALRGGSGELVYWLLSRRTPAEQAGQFNEETTLCAMAQPATKTLGLFGSEHYQIEYDDAALFAGAHAQSHTKSQFDDAHTRFDSEPLPIALGVALQAPATQAWPSGEALVASLRSVDASGHKGAPARTSEQKPFVRPPVDYSGKRRATTFYVASRVVLRQSAQRHSADRYEGEAFIAELGGQPALNTALVGCLTDDGGSCSDGDLSLCNMFQPGLRQQGAGRAIWQRVAADARCSDVRAALP